MGRPWWPGWRGRVEITKVASLSSIAANALAAQHLADYDTFLSSTTDDLIPTVLKLRVAVQMSRILKRYKKEHFGRGDYYSGDIEMKVGSAVRTVNGSAPIPEVYRTFTKRRYY